MTETTSADLLLQSEARPVFVGVFGRLLVDRVQHLRAGGIQSAEGWSGFHRGTKDPWSLGWFQGKGSGDALTSWSP